MLDFAESIRKNWRMPKRSSTRRTGRKDVNQIAARIVEEATGEHSNEDDDKNPAAVELGRRGGLKGGKARAAKLSKKRRTEIARKAANSRWKKKSGRKT